MQGVAELQAAVPEYKMSFADIVQGRDASVRVTNDKLIYAVDLIQVFTGKNINDAGQVLLLYFFVNQSNRLNGAPISQID